MPRCAGADDHCRISDDLSGVDWAALKADLTADDFDNGRSPAALRRSFEQSQYPVLARDGAGSPGR